MKKNDSCLDVLSWYSADQLLAPKLGSSLKKFLSPSKIDSQKQMKIAHLFNWEALADAEILATLTEKHMLKGMFFIVTDLSYTKFDGVFYCLISQIDDFINSYYLISGECMFNGDVFFISAEDNAIYYFHHDGYWFFIDLNMLNET